MSVAPASPRNIIFLLDESVLEGSSGKVLALALSVVEDVDVVRDGLSALLAERLADPYGSTAVSTLTKEGLHWNTLTPDDRTRATECVRSLPFRSFVAFGALAAEDKATYDGVYRVLLDKLIEGRLVRYDGCHVAVMAEENSKVRGNTLSKAVNECYARLAKQGSRRPAKLPTTAVVKKRADAALPLPDLVLGIFADYARSKAQAAGEQAAKKKQTSGAQAEARFEQIRDRVRAVYDVDTGNVYSRRRPFSPWAGAGSTAPQPPPSEAA